MRRFAMLAMLVCSVLGAGVVVACSGGATTAQHTHCTVPPTDADCVTTTSSSTTSTSTTTTTSTTTPPTAPPAPPVHTPPHEAG